ncbi:hypothetical protein [Streptomyces sp. NPDC050564]|uniref:hypothetical protein n=1 Tax=Streptomyces sp. NPDC050564 TaxID=3365631 RepID=UPI0037BB5A1E
MEAAEIGLGDEGFVVLAGRVVESGKPHDKPPGGVIDDAGTRGHLKFLREKGTGLL